MHAYIFKMADTSFTPFVYWGQNHNHIFLRIDLTELEVFTVSVLIFQLRKHYIAAHIISAAWICKK